MKELDEAEARLKHADEVIRKLNLKPLNRLPDDPQRNLENLTTKCQKCSRWIHDEDFDIHWQRCPWKCGLCGIEHFDKYAAMDHAWKCARGSTINPGY